MFLFTNFVSAGYCLGNLDCSVFDDTHDSYDYTCEELENMGNYCSWGEEFGSSCSYSYNQDDCEMDSNCMWDDNTWECKPAYIYCSSGYNNANSCSIFDYSEGDCEGYSDCTWESGCLNDADCSGTDTCEGESLYCSGTYLNKIGPGTPDDGDDSLYRQMEGGVPKLCTLEYDQFDNPWYSCLWEEGVMYINADDPENFDYDSCGGPCSDAGNYGYMIYDDTWYRHTCVENVFIICLNSRWQTSKTLLGPGYITRNCGSSTCDSYSSCSWNTVYGTCEAPPCTAETDTAFCLRLEKDCSFTDNDNCGDSRTVNCGDCIGEDECVNGVCTCVPNCVGKECGDDGCLGSCGICPEGDCIEGICQEPNSYWSLDEYTEIITPPILEISIGYTIKLIVENSEYPEGAIPFEVLEQDPLFDDNIRTGKSGLTGYVDTNGKAVAEWTITEQDLEDAFGFGGEENNIYDEFEFLFKAGMDGEFKSGTLYAQYVLGVCDQITLCEHYETSTPCNADGCGVAEASVPSDIDCASEEEDYNCRCEYDTNLGKCLAKWDYTEDNPNNPGTDLIIGTCVYTTDESIDPLGCEDDGYLSYGWVGEWTWDSLNAYTPEPDSNNGDYVEYTIGSDEWHYDPNDKKSLCEDSGVTIVACPAQIELPFFSTWGIVVTIALIVLIYFILNMKKQKGKKKKTKKKK